jgi:hypothetical protein
MSRYCVSSSEGQYEKGYGEQVLTNKLGITAFERQQIIRFCTDAEFADRPPSQIVPILADRGIHVASESSFYPVLRAEGLMHQRGWAKPPGTYARPQSDTATAPNRLWSWDITPLPSQVVGC